MPCATPQCKSICAMCFRTIFNGGQGSCPYCRKLWLFEEEKNDLYINCMQNLNELKPALCLMNMKLRHCNADLAAKEEWTARWELNPTQSQQVCNTIAENQQICSKKIKMIDGILAKTQSKLDELKNAIIITTPQTYGKVTLEKQAGRLQVCVNLE